MKASPVQGEVAGYHTKCNTRGGKKRQHSPNRVKCKCQTNIYRRKSHVVLHTFYTRGKKISTKTFIRGLQSQESRKRIGTQSLQHQPGGQAKPGQVKAAQSRGQPVLVQPLAGAEPVHPPLERTGTGSLEAGDGSVGLHCARTVSMVVARADMRPVAYGVPGGEETQRHHPLPVHPPGEVPADHREEALAAAGEEVCAPGQ